MLCCRLNAESKFAMCCHLGGEADCAAMLGSTVTDQLNVWVQTWLHTARIKRARQQMEPISLSCKRFRHEALSLLQCMMMSIMKQI